MSWLKVYDLKTDIENDPGQMRQFQAVTLDPDESEFGLKGTLGLYGSEKWWANIRSGIMPTKKVSGIIQRLYEAGMDNTGITDCFDIATDDGGIHSENIYTNSPEHDTLFRVGAKVTYLYACEELKKLSLSGQKQCLDIVLEVYITRE